MERFIFDTRSSLEEQPMFLKRSHKLSNTSSIPLSTQGRFHIKKPVEFDYSYYSQLQSHSSMVSTNRMSSISSLFEKDNCPNKPKSFLIPNFINSQQNKNYCSPNSLRRKKLKNNDHSLIQRHSKKNKQNHENSQFRFQKVKSQNIRHRKFYSAPINQTQGQQNKTKTSEPVLKRKGKTQKLEKGTYESNEQLAKYRKIKQEYAKFMNSTEITHAWQKIMYRYKLTGTRFNLQE